MYNVYLGNQNGDEIYKRLLEQVERGVPLTPEDLLDLVFLPLMRHRRRRQVVVRNAVRLASRLPAPQQRQTLASLIGLGHRFLEEAELDTLMEGLMTTPLYERIIDRGLKQGQLEMGRRTVQRVLAKQFGPIPAEVQARIAAVDDIDKLDALLDLALEANSLEEFAASLT